LYGRHFKKINDSTITTLERAQARADLEVSGMTEVPKKGKFVITGRTDMSNEYMFSANLTNFGIDEKFDIKEYTQRIDKKGFTTEIVYGRHTFDLAKKVSELEYKQSK
jgi:PAB1-binding protein PBP1